MGISRLRQFVIACQSAEHIDMFGALLGLDAPFVDPAVANFGLTNGVFALGDQFLEVIVPVSPDAPAQRFINRTGAGGYMAIFQTDNIGAARGRCDALGVTRVLDIDHEAISATHLHPRDTGGAIISIDEPRPAPSWEWGGPDWTRRSAIGRLIGFDIETPNVDALARRWTDILDLPLAHENGVPHIWLEDGPMRFIAGSAERICAVHVSLPNPAQSLARAAEFGLPVSGKTIAFSGLNITITN